MDVVLRLSADGTRKTTLLYPSDGVSLTFTAAAADYVQTQLIKSGAQCNQCGLLCRTTELAAGHCGAGTGCTADDELAALLTASETIQHIAMQQFGSNAVAAFVRKVHALLNESPEQPPASSLDDELWQTFYGGE